jgi:hypothetical protein
VGLWCRLFNWTRRYHIRFCGTGACHAWRRCEARTPPQKGSIQIQAALGTGLMRDVRLSDMTESVALSHRQSSCHLNERLRDNSVRGVGSLENRHAIRHLIYGWQTGVPASLVTALFDGSGASQKSSLPRGLKLGSSKWAKHVIRQ